MSAKTIVSAFVGFIGHYADEAAAISAALKATLTAIPVDAQDKAHILAAIERLEKLPETIAASAESLSGLKAQEVRVSKADVEAVVKGLLPTKAELLAAIKDSVAAELPSTLSAVLPGHVEAGVKEAMEKATKP